MAYHIVCICGRVHDVRSADAGSNLRCTCDREVSVPSLRELQELLGPDEDQDTEHNEDYFAFGKAKLRGVILILGGIGLGALSLLAARVINPLFSKESGEVVFLLEVLFWLACYFSICAGFVSIAMGKGYRGHWALLFLFLPFSWLVILCLPDMSGPPNQLDE